MDEATQARTNSAAEKAAMPMRNRYWEECDTEQKLERLRDAVERLCRDVNTLTVNLAQICGHRHGENGELLTPFRPVDPNANYAQGALAGGLYAPDNGIPHDLRTARERR